VALSRAIVYAFVDEVDEFVDDASVEALLFGYDPDQFDVLEPAFSHCILGDEVLQNGKTERDTAAATDEQGPREAGKHGTPTATVWSLEPDPYWNAVAL
jgi:hypothetical protein